MSKDKWLDEVLKQHFIIEKQEDDTYVMKSWDMIGAKKAILERTIPKEDVVEAIPEYIDMTDDQIAHPDIEDIFDTGYNQAIDDIKERLGL